MWAWMGALGVSPLAGIVSPAYGVYRQRDPENFVPEYLDHLLRVRAYVDEYTCRSSGIHDSRLRMYPEDFFDIRIIRPPIDEQNEIVRYIRETTSKIDLAIARTEREIELINEFRTALISDVVTGKIDVRSCGSGDA